MTESHLRDDITLEHQLVLRSSSMLLQKEFEGTFGSETIERFLHSSYDDFGAPDHQ